VQYLFLTEISPVAAPAGTFALISVVEAKEISESGTVTPLNFTVFSSAESSNLFPSMVTSVPTSPASGLKFDIMGQQPANISHQLENKKELTLLPSILDICESILTPPKPISSFSWVDYIE